MACRGLTEAPNVPADFGSLLNAFEVVVDSLAIVLLSAYLRTDLAGANRLLLGLLLNLRRVCVSLPDSVRFCVRLFG